MATATSRTRKATAAKAKPAPKPVEEELEEELDDEEFEEIEETEPTATPAKKKSSAAGVTYGVADLAAHLSQKTGKEVTTRELRALIRRLARDNSGRVDRTIIAGNRSRYDWPLGLKDPEVQEIIKAFEGGEGEIEKNEKLKALKDKKAAERAAATAPAAKKAVAKKTTAKKAVAKKAPEPELDEDDDDELDFGDED